MRKAQGLSFALILASLSGACNGASSSTGPVPPQPAAVEQAKPEAPSGNALPKNRPQGEPQPTLPIGHVELETPPRAPIALKVEIASTDRQREMGLMFREQLADDEGMLFLFDGERRNSFWMRNTLIPLDMFFIGSDWTVVGVVENATPLTDDPRRVPGLSQYVLEVNAGFAQKHGLGAGTKVRYRPPEGT
jgi:uncharacterized membrane protein (UPF0127 family)